MLAQQRGMTLLELAIVILIVTILGFFLLTRTPAKVEESQLEATLRIGQEIANTAERLRHTVIQTQIIQADAFLFPIEIEQTYVTLPPDSSVEDLNELADTGYPTNSAFDTPFLIEIAEDKATVAVDVPGDVSPDGVRAEFNEGTEQTRLTFFGEPENLLSEFINRPVQYEKEIWFEEETR